MAGLPNTRARLLEIAQQRVAERAQVLRNEVVEVLSTPGSGRTYTEEFAVIGGKLRVVGKRSAPHTASAPGDAPAVDTGRLRQSITAVQVEPGHWKVGTNVEYALYLEFGTRNIAPRPFMRPAAERMRRR